MKIKEIKQGFLRSLGHLLLRRVVEVWCKTLRVQKINWKALEALKRNNENIIIGFWHGTMLLPWYELRGSKYMGLTSYSKDGELLARILDRWGYKVTRGSSSRGGDVALGIMVDYAKYEGSVMVTPDGPRGPAHKFKAGAVVAAQRSERPLLLLGVGIKQKWSLKSWDKFQVPVPFTKVNIVCSDPIWVPKQATRDEVSLQIERCEELLEKLQTEAGRFDA